MKTGQAQQLLKNNREKNQRVKSEIEAEIKNLEILDNEEDIQKQLLEDEKKEEIVHNNVSLDEIEVKKEGLNTSNILVFIGIGLGIVICIIILIKQSRKK